VRPDCPGVSFYCCWGHAAPAEIHNPVCIRNCSEDIGTGARPSPGFQPHCTSAFACVWQSARKNDCRCVWGLESIRIAADLSILPKSSVRQEKANANQGLPEACVDLQDCSPDGKYCIYCIRSGPIRTAANVHGVLMTVVALYHSGRKSHHRQSK
jgi:hypothetical protein